MADKSALRAETDALVSDYLTRGGSITKCPTGARVLGDAYWAGWGRDRNGRTLLDNYSVNMERYAEFARIDARFGRQNDFTLYGGDLDLCLQALDVRIEEEIEAAAIPFWTQEACETEDDYSEESFA